MRNEIIVMTSVSGLLFCFIMVFSSLSPMPYGDAFNSVGMWSNIGFMLFFYFFFASVYCRCRLDEICDGSFLRAGFTQLPVYKYGYFGGYCLDRSRLRFYHLISSFCGGDAC